MTGQIFQNGRKVDSLTVAEPEYHYEYIAIHNQRVALIRNYTTWYVVGLAISMLMFWVFLWVGLISNFLSLIVLGAIVSTIFIVVAHSVACSIDDGVISLYPRIIFLEIILDYQFYRDFLRRRPRGETERRFIEKCENIKAETTDALWRDIHTDFNSKDFPRSRRIYRHYRWMMLGSIIIYWISGALVVYNSFYNVTS
ncbi:MAG: hypothetical protein O3A21_06485 [Proteobacteria bacterium]|nr:hypothetical protein [Pseudomonadota bacterium]